VSIAEENAPILILALWRIPIIAIKEKQIRKQSYPYKSQILTLVAQLSRAFIIEVTKFSWMGDNLALLYRTILQLTWIAKVSHNKIKGNWWWWQKN